MYNINRSKANLLLFWLFFTFSAAINKDFAKNYSISHIAMTREEHLKTFAKVEPINRGNTFTQKYYVETGDGEKFFLKTTCIDRQFYFTKNTKERFEILEDLWKKGAPIAKPIGMGNYVSQSEETEWFTLENWIEGTPLDEINCLLPTSGQYLLGIKTGEVLRKLHSCLTLQDMQNGSIHYKSRLDEALGKCKKYDLHLNDIDRISSWIYQNLHMLKNRPQSAIHWDSDLKNMMWSGGCIKLVDFDCVMFSDPWEDLLRDNHISLTGRIHGYFAGEPPEEFWVIQTLFTYLRGIEFIAGTCDSVIPEHFDNAVKYYDYLLSSFDDANGLITPRYQSSDKLLSTLCVEYQQSLQQQAQLSAELEDRLRKMTDKAERLQALLEQESKKIIQMESSAYWRITKPIRIISDTVKKWRTMI